MISGSMDSQTSSDVYDTGTFQLPNPAGKAGGACTSALLKVLQRRRRGTGQPSWVDILREMRQVLGSLGYDQIPQLTTSRCTEVNKPFGVVPQGFTGTKRCVLIGINYCGQNGELRGCHNDVLNVKKYLEQVHGFRDAVVLMDDGRHKSPTKKNILRAFKLVAKQSKSGDAVFIHYSGHGGRLRDNNGDEEDGYDETLIPLDFKKAGQISDDDLLQVLIRPLAAGVFMTCLMDCCHSGTVLDLPYKYTATSSNMELNEKFRAEKFMFTTRCSWLLNVLNFLAFAGNFAVTYGIGVLGFNGAPTNAELSEKYQTLITPAGWTFSIWAVIFTAQLLWSVAQLLLPAFRGAPLVRNGIRWYYIGVCIAQIGWTVAFSAEIIWLSLTAMLFILMFLVLIVVSQYNTQSHVSICGYLLLKFPFSVHAGWIVAASLVNISVLLVDLGVSANLQYYVALASLIGLLFVALFAVFWPARPELVVPLVLVWASVGISSELVHPTDSITSNFESDDIKVVRYLAIAMCSAVLSVDFCGVMRSCCQETTTQDKEEQGEYYSMQDV